MPLPSNPTQTVGTQSQYRKRAYELARRCRKDLQLSMHQRLDERQFVGWLISLKPSLARPAWRQYKSSVIYYLEQEVARTNDAISQEALETLSPIDVTGCVSKTQKTSGSKNKKFPAKDYFKIDQKLQTPGKWHEPLRLWLAAGLLTGLRPIEWAGAQYVTLKNGETALIIKNAKSTNGRSHGETRTLLLGGLSAEEKKIISDHAERCNEWDQAHQFHHYYRACAAILSRTSRTLWPSRPNHYCLYSMRHQFTADAKASGMTREEIATMMGHAVDDTATKHYGKKTAGYQLVRVRPDPSEVARVRKVYQERYLGDALRPRPKSSPENV